MIKWKETKTNLPLVSQFPTLELKDCPQTLIESLFPLRPPDKLKETNNRIHKLQYLITTSLKINI